VVVYPDEDQGPLPKEITNERASIDVLQGGIVVGSYGAEELGCEETRCMSYHRLSLEVQLGYVLSGVRYHCNGKGQCWYECRCGNDRFGGIVEKT